MKKKKIKYLLIYVLLLFISGKFSTVIAQDFLLKHKDSFHSPPIDCWPHTRWWWPGNAQTKENITYELEQMRSVGIRGVEQITMSPFYPKGNIEYLSAEFMELIKHTVKEAKRLEMEVSFNYGGPGWIIGGEWVTDEDKSRDMIPTFIDVEGPMGYNDKLPVELAQTERSWEMHRPELVGHEKLLAVVAGRLKEGVIDSSSLTVLSDFVTNDLLNWNVPAGTWRIAAFWLSIDTTHNSVNHFDKDVMERYCEYIGGKFYSAVGDEFGKTVESFFCDSFELPYQPSGIKWSDDLLKRFQVENEYDLAKYLPAIWWEVEGVTPKIRYDVNQFLAEIGLETFYKPFLKWCKENGVKGRIQAYGFETDNIKSAGITDLPEMEITPGEKDQHPWYDTRIGPKKYVSSGAHIYGKNVVSVEAHTFLHWERYRATMEEVKISTDGFLRSGANKFYNHGFSSSLERDLAPSRRMPWAPQINPTNVWWKYYPLLTQYTARCSYLLRQGDFAPDIAIYSPLANQWTKNVLNARRWTRDFDWGELGDLLISNGYDFDLLNDEALQELAKFSDGDIKIQNMRYKILLLPNIESIPLETLRKIEEYVKTGGKVVALDRLPEFSTGYKESKQYVEEVRKIVTGLFGNLNGRSIEPNRYEKGNSHFLKQVIHREIWWDQYSSTLDPFLKIIKNYIAPDFEIDFAYEELRKNNGLTFLHRKTKNADIYFVSNIQDRHVNYNVKFRADKNNLFEWDPYSGEINELFTYSVGASGVTVPINLAPWESTILVFENGIGKTRVTKTNANKIISINSEIISAELVDNGNYYFEIIESSGNRLLKVNADDIVSPFEINGKWKLVLDNEHFSRIEKELDYLSSWSDDDKTKHFSGTGVYEIIFDLPAKYIDERIKLELDLGKIGNIGEVIINGQDAGVVWMKGQKCDITQHVEEKNNSLIIHVTNTNINRVSSFKEIVPVPDKMIKRFGNANKNVNLPREFGFKPLPPSGLIGPVKIIPSQIIKINYN